MKNSTSKLGITSMVFWLLILQWQYLQISCVYICGFCHVVADEYQFDIWYSIHILINALHRKRIISYKLFLARNIVSKCHTFSSCDHVVYFFGTELWSNVPYILMYEIALIHNTKFSWQPAASVRMSWMHVCCN